MVLLGDLQLGDVLVVSFDLGIDSDFLLVKDGLLRAEIIILAVNLALLLNTLDVLNLTRDPVFLDISRLIIDLLDLLLDIVTHVLSGSHKLIAIATAF